MQHAYGKSAGIVSRVRIGQILVSVRCKQSAVPIATEALRRAKFKFPGRQKIVLSKKWGFTKYNGVDYINMRKEGLLEPDGNIVKYIPRHGRMPMIVAT